MLNALTSTSSTLTHALPLTALPPTAAYSPTAFYLPQLYFSHSSTSCWLLPPQLYLPLYPSHSSTSHSSTSAK
ncbi:hypothetical protein RRG08_060771 [Elysia crispata]|uniref:Uncharacterized protein n=1 Tax=Elysia crispata TaxID=231223 RepID=A0AAE1D6Z8_9GAST|nr:hypothetical protein RRG08_060771 [Elysia crispata]